MAFGVVLLIIQRIASVLLLVPNYSQSLSAPAVLKAGPSCRNYDAVLIDVENLRGKSAFRLSYGDVLRAVDLWSNGAVPELRGRIVLVMDHGACPSSFYLPREGYSVVFSGPLAKADDVIALDAVPFLVGSGGGGRHHHHNNSSASCCVVTADRGLIQRCHRVVSSGKTNKLTIMNPLWLLQDLELLLKQQQSALDSSSSAAAAVVEGGDQIEESSSDWELHVGAELLVALVELRACVIRNKRRKACKLKVAMLEAKLLTPAVLRIQTVLLPLLLDSISSSSSKPTSPEVLLSELVSNNQLRLLTRARTALVTSNRFRTKRIPGDDDAQGGRERTRDRATRAEQLRLRLDSEAQARGEHNTTTMNGEDGAEGDQPAPIAWNLVRWMRRSIHPASTGGGSASAQLSLTLVVLSNTHGSERLMGGGAALPPGDVLLHLGGFTPIQTSDPNRQGTRRQLEAEALGAFDQWLERQPHRHKIVLRGKDDPRKVALPRSQALFVTQPMQTNIDGFKLSLVPNVGSGLTNRCLPKTGVDVVASYIPPLDLLDGTRKGSGGSAVLRRGLDRMVERKAAPVLVLCGEINESRGAVRHHDLLVVNVANAIPSAAGPAPAVLQLTCTSALPRQRSVRLVHMERQYEYLNRYDSARFFTAQAGAMRSLLAVDLGLRTGLCLFNDAGMLLRYDDRQFASVDDLEQGAAAILSDWEAESASRISHVAIEGSDPDLLSAWSNAVGDRRVLHVQPEHWRHDLLTPKECDSWKSSKEASRVAARSIIERFGSAELDRVDYTTDCAEALLLGAHVAQRLGWIRRELPTICA
jgi:hypothetical protein